MPRTLLTLVGFIYALGVAVALAIGLLVNNEALPVFFSLTRFFFIVVAIIWTVSLIRKTAVRPQGLMPELALLALFAIGSLDGPSMRTLSTLGMLLLIGLYAYAAMKGGWPLVKRALPLFLLFLTIGFYIGSKGLSAHFSNGANRHLDPTTQL